MYPVKSQDQNFPDSGDDAKGDYLQKRDDVDWFDQRQDEDNGCLDGSPSKGNEDLHINQSNNCSDSPTYILSNTKTPVYQRGEDEQSAEEISVFDKEMKKMEENARNTDLEFKNNQ